MTTNVSLRPATHDDYDFLWWLHCVTMRPSVEATWGWDEAWQAAYFREHFDPTSRNIIEVDGDAVGVISVERRDDLIFLAAVEIAPAYQHRGIATTLIGGVLDEAGHEGVPVELYVLKVNPARRLYERLGFVVIHETETHFIMRWLPDRLT